MGHLFNHSLASCPCFLAAEPTPAQLSAFLSQSCWALPWKITPSSQCLCTHPYLEPLCPVMTLWFWSFDVPFIFRWIPHWGVQSFRHWISLISPSIHSALSFIWTICSSLNGPCLYAHRPPDVNPLASFIGLNVPHSSRCYFTDIHPLSTPPGSLLWVSFPKKALGISLLHPVSNLWCSSRYCLLYLGTVIALSPSQDCELLKGSGRIEFTSYQHSA